ncbi:hypothetical protein LEP1GSC107_2531 [Leptospira interrogans serovar Grippotyphosa str. UI 12769]|uniref:Uncharacterized protein n=4 Tax=Leptospira interrogans TaxID=173 RepID=A0A0E2D9H9_LEPIR|nr:hypothetical protein BRAT_11485 [Leptospira interrogans serovar Bratislava]EKO27424.1 hypothetical protein LEP1GSC104_1976 [Leptospira interrogans str. UI 12621]EKO88371.1 hypothetical protein LEP1GSC009_1547 [Leptospira interrogans serovar Grippotyphosa str. Andaman]EKP83895.1 hypothetical protein LEP1GSC020_3935 [Leptospira interrogans serovar Grippotyphosa str. 2006006986]EKR46802.1 hypothetical protein LEP1GSC097_2921 [Leptospira interrogans serovar Grippotyphosa str. UI 08368]EKR56526.
MYFLSEAHIYSCRFNFRVAKFYSEASSHLLLKIYLPFYLYEQINYLKLLKFSYDFLLKVSLRKK